jgi:hypothetical protein
VTRCPEWDGSYKRLSGASMLRPNYEAVNFPSFYWLQICTSFLSPSISAVQGLIHVTPLLKLVTSLTSSSTMKFKTTAKASIIQSNFFLKSNRHHISISNSRLNSNSRRRRVSNKIQIQNEALNSSSTTALQHFQKRTSSVALEGWSMKVIALL